VVRNMLVVVGMVCGMWHAGCCARWCVLFYLNPDVAPLSLRLAKTDSQLPNPKQIKFRSQFVWEGPLPSLFLSLLGLCFAASSALFERGARAEKISAALEVAFACSIAWALGAGYPLQGPLRLY
jgi:hypothetical protein